MCTENEYNFQEPVGVLFVDDEEKTRKLLTMTIDWKDLGYCVVGEASSAEQAFEIVSQFAPEVIITDIEMPYINGLEFTKIILNEYPHIKVVILTAHDNFEYAKQSLEIGISSFILKPIRRNEISTTMAAIREQIILEKRNLYEKKSLESKLKENRDVIIQNILSSLLLDNRPNDNLVYDLQYYNIPIKTDTKYYNIMLLSILAVESYEEGLFHQIQCQELIKNTSKKIKNSIVFSDSRQNIVFLSQDKTINLYAYATYFYSLAKKKLGVDLVSGIGIPVENIESISLSYKQSYEQLYMNIRNQNSIWLSKDFSNQEYLDKLQQKIQNISFFIKVLQKQELLEQVAIIFELMKNNKETPFSSIIVNSMSIVNTVLTAIDELGIPFHDIYETDNLPYPYILKMKTIDDIENYITNFVLGAIEQLEQFNNSNHKTLIYSVLTYIHEHIGDSNLSLKNISEEHYINPSYLSRIFKENTGKKFLDYLTDLRIEKAKNLLQKSDFKIYEISHLVGVEDPNYFSKYFKKHTGLTPAQYKESLKNE